MGNKTGWIVAIVVVLVLGVIIAKVLIWPSPTDSTGAVGEAGVMKIQTVAKPVQDVIGVTLGSDAGNAADDYHKAFEIYKSDADALDEAIAHTSEFQKGLRTLDPARMDEVKKIERLIAQGLRKKDMNYYMVYTPKEMIVGFYTVDGVKDLQKLSDCLQMLAAYYYGKRDYEQAVKVLGEELLFAQHLINERARTAIVWAGYQMQVRVLGMLEKIYAEQDNKQRLAATKDYARQLRELMYRYEKLANIVWKLKNPNPGDVFAFAEDHEDRAWRVQGILAAGLIKHAARSRGDKRYVGVIVDEYIDSNDPVEAAAAKAVKEFTVEDYKNVYGK